MLVNCWAFGRKLIKPLTPKISFKIHYWCREKHTHTRRENTLLPSCHYFLLQVPNVTRAPRLLQSWHVWMTKSQKRDRWVNRATLHILCLKRERVESLKRLLTVFTPALAQNESLLILKPQSNWLIISFGKKIWQGRNIVLQEKLVA